MFAPWIKYDVFYRAGKWKQLNLPRVPAVVDNDFLIRLQFLFLLCMSSKKLTSIATQLNDLH